MLHVAPERCLESNFRKAVQDYTTADLLKPDVMVRMDITDIQYPDDYFTFIYCSHVLEHVPEDRKAMREFYRVLQPGGEALLLVPITMKDRTFEDPTVTDPNERYRIFGQDDHVRRYGPDYTDRLREAGFVVNVISVAEVVGEAEAVRFGLTPAAGLLHYCIKP